MKLQVLTQENLEQVRIWRNENLAMLRTPYMLTDKQQVEYYHNVICNPNSGTRYWGIWSDCKDLQPEEERLHFIGMTGFEGIEWENRLAEIGLIINPEYGIDKYGEEAVELILEQAFDYMNLENIFGECYLCNPALDFWEKICEKYQAFKMQLLNRKYFNGRYWNSLYFNINRKDWKTAGVTQE